mgnify:CR=1 FL=1|jgi:hypothetical protein
MKAIGYKVPGPIAADAALVDINLSYAEETVEINLVN